MTENELLKRIQELSFAKLETQLYLDVYPENAAAQRHFHELSDKLDSLVDQYQGAHAPLFADGAGKERWNWVDTPWPWQKNGNTSK